jgi:hypothetical protein
MALPASVQRVQYPVQLLYCASCYGSSCQYAKGSISRATLVPLAMTLPASVLRVHYPCNYCASCYGSSCECAKGSISRATLVLCLLLWLFLPVCEGFNIPCNSRPSCYDSSCQCSKGSIEQSGARERWNSVRQNRLPTRRHNSEYLFHCILC